MVSTRGQLSQGKAASTGAQARQYEDADPILLVSSDEESIPLTGRRKSSSQIRLKIERGVIPPAPLRMAPPLPDLKPPFPLKIDTVEASPSAKRTTPPSKKQKTTSGSKGSRRASLPIRKSPRKEGCKATSTHATPKNDSPPPVAATKTAEVVPQIPSTKLKSPTVKKVSFPSTSPSKIEDTPVTAPQDEGTSRQKSNVDSKTMPVGRPPLIPGTGGPNHRSGRQPKNYFEELQYTRSVLEKSRIENQRLETVIEGLKQRKSDTTDVLFERLRRPQSTTGMKRPQSEPISTKSSPKKCPPVGESSTANTANSPNVVKDGSAEIPGSGSQQKQYAAPNKVPPTMRKEFLLPIALQMIEAMKQVNGALLTGLQDYFEQTKGLIVEENEAIDKLLTGMCSLDPDLLKHLGQRSDKA